MAVITSSQGFPIPVRIGKLIQSRNRGAQLIEAKTNSWVVKSNTLYCYKSWFMKTLPFPWNEQIFKLLYTHSTAPYRKLYKNFFILSDYPFTQVEFPLSFELATLIQELGKRYSMHEIEVLISLLKQIFNSLTNSELSK